MKRYMVAISLLLIFFVYDSLAAPTSKREVQKHAFLGVSLGYSRYFVDPDVDLDLSGLTLEMKWVRLRKATYPIWGFESSEKGFNLLYSKVLNGRIDVNDISLTYGRRYNFHQGRLHPYIGFDTGLSWLFSGRKVDEQSGYVLKTGIRPCLNINTGAYYDIKRYLKFGLNLKYSFSVKKVRLHNLLARHKHEDIFHYFSLGFDVKLGSRGIRSLVMKTGLAKSYESKFIALDSPTFVSSSPFIPLTTPLTPHNPLPPLVRGIKGDKGGQGVVYLREYDEVIGIVINGRAKAYPLKTAAWHHIIHDELGGMPILVTFCPLTYTAMVFDRTIYGKVLEFNVDGLIDNNMIMVDRQTKSRWIQITGEAVNGKMRGKRLKLLYSLHTTWGTWRNLHPDTLVLSHDTGFKYNYDEYPFGKRYIEYRENWRIMFPLSYEDERFHPKEVVLAIEVGKTFKAYPLSNMGEREVINDVIGGNPILIVYDKESQLALAFSRIVNGRTLEFELDEASNYYQKTKSLVRLPNIKDYASESRWDFEGAAYQGKGERENLTPIPSFKAYWFAWAVFHPDALVYEK